MNDNMLLMRNCYIYTTQIKVHKKFHFAMYYDNNIVITGAIILLVRNRQDN